MHIKMRKNTKKKKKELFINKKKRISENIKISQILYSRDVELIADDDVVDE